MNTKLFIVIFMLVITGCSSLPNPTQTQVTNLSSPTLFLTQTLILTPTNTPIPSPTLTPSITPIVSITPQLGFDIWDTGSKLGVHTIQYPEDEWIEEGGQLSHTTLNRCFLAEHGGTDMCMAGGCPNSTNIALGDVAFSKMALGNSSAYYTSGPYFALSFEVHSFSENLGEDAACIEAAEKVLSTLQIRPERGCNDRAAFVADVTIPDNTVIPAGTKFVKTWRLRNVGTCTWTKLYTLVIYGKSSGTEADWAPLPEIVPPGETIDISIEIPAPQFAGISRWEGVLRNELRDSFGLGSDPYTDMFGRPFWVQIIVAPAPSP
jgi:hypothetical protein